MNHVNFRTALAVLAMTASLGLAAPAPAHDASSSSHARVAAVAQPFSSKAAKTQDTLRDLWLGHIFWVRNVAVATVAHNPAAAKAAETMVVANAQAIAGAIEPYYGKAAKDALFDLLAGHYGAIKEYLDATVRGSEKVQNAATDNLTANARAIAAFLSGANPNLPKDALEGLLLAHGSHHLRQIQELRADNYAAERETWNAMLGHIYAIADALTVAIAKQFPERFG